MFLFILSKIIDYHFISSLRGVTLEENVELFHKE